MNTYRFFLLIFLSFILVQNSYSLPRFALRQNDRCIDCHVNPTGGLIRNANGFYFGKNVVSLISPREKEFKLIPKLSDNITFGFDYRSQYLYSQEKKRSDFQEMAASVYTSVAISDKIDVLARYDFLNYIWEGYAIARILPNDGYVKVGSFQPYFGIRLDDHTSYTKGGDIGLLFATGVRQGLFYDPFYVETGLEVGLNFSEIAQFTASVGKSRFNRTLSRDPAYTARLELRPSIDKLHLMVGGSFVNAKIPQNTTVYGGFGGLNYDRFTIMGEYDIGEDYKSTNYKSSFMMVKAIYKVMLGLDAVARFDRFDPNTNVSSDEFSHLLFGLEFFPYSFVELRPQFRINLENPEVNNNAFVLQLHLWY